MLGSHSNSNSGGIPSGRSHSGRSGVRLLPGVVVVTIVEFVSFTSVGVGSVIGSGG